MDTEGLIAWLIVQSWEDFFRQRGRLSKQDMAGCLNVVIESIEARMRRRGGRSYLKYIEKFMKRAGVSMELVSPDELGEFEDDVEDGFYDLEQMSLLELGELFLSDPDVIGVDDAFENRAHTYIANGRADQVIGLCQRWLKQADDNDDAATLYVRAILHTVEGTAYRHRGDLEQAVESFQAAQSPQLIYTDALNKLAETYREMEQYEQAIQTWRECLGDPRSDAYFYRQIAQTYRQQGDLDGEEQALRDLVAVSKRGGCLLLGWGARDSITALAQLTDCLRRQEGREPEQQKLSARIRRYRPHIRRDDFDDWAYWVREWMLID